MIYRCEKDEFETIYTIINNAAQAYKGIIPADRWHEPYMTKDQLRQQIREGVEFWGCKEGEDLIGVMGIQYKGEVTSCISPISPRRAS